ncbi:multidrug effflux MFS transporter [Roseibium sp. MMSF_3544]|uniref:multidrug effflux MFS transporter n=1 Tax=unclassified Roseibium TaxID=2629323 RepID=UPI00273F3014|nr:multidrug effflux MFS transporter [Roseibium sp. MMSF_3544]
MTRTPPQLITLIVLTAFSPLTLNMFLPSLGNIALDLQADYALVSVAIAGYLAVTAVIQLIAGPLSDRYGRRPVLLVALVIFCLSSLVCALAENIWVFLAFRMLQGGITAGYSLSLAIVRDTNSPQKSAGVIGYISMCMAVAPMLGPVIGGLLDTAFGWRANFYFYGLCGAALLALVWFDLGETRPERNKEKEARRGSLFTLIGDPRFCAYALCSAFSVGGFYIFLAGAPLVATQTFGVTPAELGILIGTITVGFSAGGFLSGKLATRVSLPTLVLSGRIVATTGLAAGLLAFLLGAITPLVFFGSTVFVGIGNGLTLPGSNSSAMSVRPDLAGSAAGLVAAFNLACGSVLTSLTGFAMDFGNKPVIVLTLMFVTAASGLLAALAALGLERSGRVSPSDAA